MVRLLYCFLCSLCCFWAQAQDFRVQITARAEPLSAAYFKEHGIEKYQTVADPMGIYRYFAGAYNTRDEAEKVVSDIKLKGFPFAYVIDLEEQRILSDAICPYFHNGAVYEKDSSGLVHDIFFDAGRTDLSTAAKTTLNEVAEILVSSKKYYLNLNGYTDASGSAQQNAELAAERARTARNYLIAKGIQADRMYIRVYGEANPMADNTNEEGEDMPKNRQLNRRVQLLITEQPEGQK
jgi:outer membrane protein OmpA-like peptidoglycan-associated protein